MASSKLEDMYRKFSAYIKKNPDIKHKLIDTIRTTVGKIYTDVMKSEEGYCYRFKLPEKDVSELYKLANIDEKELAEAFKEAWGAATMSNRMFNNPYYLILLFLLYWALKDEEHDKELAKNIATLILIRVWNGRRMKYIKYCDPRVMNYVVNVMMNKRFIVTSYSNPFQLIKDYYAPTLLTKYKPQILHNGIAHPLSLKRFLEQAHARIVQIFASNFQIDPKTGQKLASTGLLPLYMRAKQEGKYMSAEVSNEEEPFEVENNIDEITHETVNFITTNTFASYSDKFANNISIDLRTNVRRDIVKLLAQSIHNPEYDNLLSEIIPLMLNRLQIKDKNKVCTLDFLVKVKRLIVSSKNNPEVNQLYKLIGELLKKIQEEKNLTFNYSTYLMRQLENVLIYTIAYNIQLANCRHNT